MSKESLDKIKSAEAQVKKMLADAEEAARSAAEEADRKIRQECADFSEQLKEERKKRLADARREVDRLRGEAQKESEALFDVVSEKYKPNIQKAADAVANMILK